MLDVNSTSDFPEPQLVDVNENDEANYDIEEEMCDLEQDPIDVNKNYKRNFGKVEREDNSLLKMSKIITARYRHCDSYFDRNSKYLAQEQGAKNYINRLNINLSNSRVS